MVRVYPKMEDTPQKHHLSMEFGGVVYFHIGMSLKNLIAVGNKCWCSQNDGYMLQMLNDLVNLVATTLLNIFNHAILTFF